MHSKNFDCILKLSPRKVLSDEHASGRCILEISGDWNLFSTPQPRKRQLPTVSLLPSGPRPVSAVRVRRSVLQQIRIPAPSKQDVASQLRLQAGISLTHLPLASSPAYRRFRVTGNAGLPGLAHQLYKDTCNLYNYPHRYAFFAKESERFKSFDKKGKKYA